MTPAAYLGLFIVLATLYFTATVFHPLMAVAVFIGIILGIIIACMLLV